MQRMDYKLQIEIIGFLSTMGVEGILLEEKKNI